MRNLIQATEVLRYAQLYKMLHLKIKKGEKISSVLLIGPGSVQLQEQDGCFLVSFQYMLLAALLSPKTKITVLEPDVNNYQTLKHGYLNPESVRYIFNLTLYIQKFKYADKQDNENYSQTFAKIFSGLLGIIKDFENKRIACKQEKVYKPYLMKNTQFYNRTLEEYHAGFTNPPPKFDLIIATNSIIYAMKKTPGKAVLNYIVTMSLLQARGTLIIDVEAYDFFKIVKQLCSRFQWTATAVKPPYEAATQDEIKEHEKIFQGVVPSGSIRRTPSYQAYRIPESDMAGLARMFFEKESKPYNVKQNGIFCKRVLETLEKKKELAIPTMGDIVVINPTP